MGPAMIIDGGTSPYGREGKKPRRRRRTLPDPGLFLIQLHEFSYIVTPIKRME